MCPITSKSIAHVALFVIGLGTFSTFLARYSTESITTAFIGVRLMCAILIYVIGYWIFLNSKETWKQRAMQLVPAAFVICLVISVFIGFVLSDDKSNVWLHVQNMGILFMPMVLVGAFSMNDFSWAKAAAMTISRLGVIVGLVGLLQWAVGYNFIRSIGTNVIIGDGGFGANYGSALDGDGRPLFRAFSVLLNHYDVCAYLIMSSLFSMYALAMRHIKMRRFIVWNLVYFAGILVTYNVTGWLLFVGVLCGGGAIFSFSKHIILPLKWKIGFAILLAALLGALIGSEFSTRIIQNSDINLASQSSAASRVLLLLNCVELIRLRPLGWGWGFSSSHLPLHATSDNYYFWIAVFGGFWYALMYAGLFIATIIRGVYSLRGLLKRKEDLFVLQVVLILWVVAAFLCGFSNFFVAKSVPAIILFWLSLGMVWSVPAQAHKDVS